MEPDADPTTAILVPNFIGHALDQENSATPIGEQMLLIQWIGNGLALEPLPFVFHLDLKGVRCGEEAHLNLLRRIQRVAVLDGVRYRLARQQNSRIHEVVIRATGREKGFSHIHDLFEIIERALEGQVETVW